MEEDKKKKELVTVVQKHKNKPEALAKEVARVLSATYHEKNR